MTSLFSKRDQAPLAERVRPERTDEVVGQERILEPGSLLATALGRGEVPSLVLWGPPGTGKTTLARLLARESDMAFSALSAVTSGVKDVREVIKVAKERARFGERTLLFVDEIHRFNRAQQDAFLPHIEDGTVALIGATTENPGFSLIGALLSRLRVVVLRPLSAEALDAVIDRALGHSGAGFPRPVTVDVEARAALVAVSGGDARRLLNVLESAVDLADARAAGDQIEVTSPDVEEAAQTRLVAYDRSGDGRYDMLSAFHKSLRGSDVDAALYWMSRMLVGGEDPNVILRRLVVMASEDIGLADPESLRAALAARDALQFLGRPEGEYALAQAVIHLANAPKSNAVALALREAKNLATETVDEGVPIHLRNAPTAFARTQGHGEGYEFPHDLPNAFSAQAHLPPALEDAVLYHPKSVGAEREQEKRLAWWDKLRGRVRGDPS